MAQGHLGMLNFLLEHPCMHAPELLGRKAQWGLERSFKGLLAARNAPIRFKRDSALLWRHVERVRPIADREGAEAM